MNPAVSLLMFFKGQMSIKKMAGYWLAQFIGALLASSLLWGSVSDMQGPIPGTEIVVRRPPLDLGATVVNPGLSHGNAFLLEFMGSFFFYLVIAQTALDKRGVAQSMFPAIPIGLVLVVVHITLIPFTGCGVNPARTFGPSMVVCMVGSCDRVVHDTYWVYYIAPFVAAFVVAEVTTWMEYDPDAEEDGTVKEAVEEAPTQESPEKAVEREASVVPMSAAEED